MSPGHYDVVVVGGGPAGLSAALWLARFRRRVHVVDGGHPRNRATWAVHGYPGLPDLPPDELRRRLRDQAIGAGAEVRGGRILAIGGTRDDFSLDVDDGSALRARRVLLAFGLRDELPPLPGLEEAYGTS
ncbi:MAG TPA: FAD-dependent oxidoreductase, partial [Longimicrobiales bacterium]